MSGKKEEMYTKKKTKNKKQIQKERSRGKPPRYFLLVCGERVNLLKSVKKAPATSSEFALVKRDGVCKFVSLSLLCFQY